MIKLKKNQLKNLKTIQVNSSELTHQTHQNTDHKIKIIL